VKECSPGGGARDSKPQATMASMVPYCERMVELAAAQVSRRMRTSDLAFAKRLWIADQSTDAYSGPWPQTHSACLALLILPCPA
jgi:hypothetical protein